MLTHPSCQEEGHCRRQGRHCALHSAQILCFQCQRILEIVRCGGLTASANDDYSLLRHDGSRGYTPTCDGESARRWSSQGIISNVKTSPATVRRGMVLTRSVKPRLSKRLKPRCLEVLDCRSDCRNKSLPSRYNVLFRTSGHEPRGYSMAEEVLARM